MLVAKQFINPDGLSKPTAYSHIVSATGGKVVFISGQIAYDSEGNLVGADDFRAQVQQVLKNVEIAVQSAGGSLNDIVKITSFIPNYDLQSHRPIFNEVRKEVFGDHAPASSLVGVQALVFPEILVEIEAIAILD
jgi:enamine deaminase RidA (YjgF/YER057c/UK114 family)